LAPLPLVDGRDAGQTFDRDTSEEPQTRSDANDDLNEGEGAGVRKQLIHSAYHLRDNRRS